MMPSKKSTKKAAPKTKSTGKIGSSKSTKKAAPKKKK
jgi:hypothetical protein